jgi:hypothetical protein
MPKKKINYVEADGVDMSPTVYIYFFDKEKFLKTLITLYDEFDVFTLPNGDMMCIVGSECMYRYVKDKNDKKDTSWLG